MPAAANSAPTLRPSAASISAMPFTQTADVVRSAILRVLPALGLVRPTNWPPRSLTRRGRLASILVRICHGTGRLAIERGTNNEWPAIGGNLSRKHWLAAYGGRIPAEINPDAYASVLAMLEAAMKRYAEKPAFRCFGQTLTYADTDRLSRKFAAYLQHKLGVKKGDRIAVMLPNLPAFPLAMLGIVRAGAVQVNVNPLYTPRELEHQLNDAGVEIIVIFSGVVSDARRDHRQHQGQTRDRGRDSATASASSCQSRPSIAGLRTRRLICRRSSPKAATSPSRRWR